MSLGVRWASHVLALPSLYGYCTSQSVVRELLVGDRPLISLRFRPSTSATHSCAVAGACLSHVKTSCCAGHDNAVQQDYAHHPRQVAAGPPVVSKRWRLAEVRHVGDCVDAPATKE